MPLFTQRFALAISLFFAFAWQVALAQETACQAIVAGALQDLARHCAALERNSVCYGHQHIAVSFAAHAGAPGFSAPGQRAPLLSVQRIQSSGLQPENRHWGVAILHLQADLPQTRPGPGVLMLLAGAASLAQTIDQAHGQAQIDELGAPLSTAALQPTTRFSQAAAIAPIIGPLRQHEIALVDARTRGGQWLRVVNGGVVSWVERAHLAPLQAMASLPVVDVAKPFAMQKFTFSSTSDALVCRAAEPMLAIQTAAESPANLTVNGVDLHARSLVIFQQAQSDALRMTVHRGAVSTAFGNTVRAGSSVIGALAENERGHSVVQGWSDPRPVSDAERERGQMARQAFDQLAGKNG